MEPEDRNIIFIGSKPILTYVSATLTQLSTRPVITIKARGKKIT
ncbi:MAG: DNA-binding protein, partial [Nitrosopumilus sp.]